MGSSTIKVGRIFGIELKLDYSWFVIFALVSWSLATHHFPSTHPGWPTETYWWMALATSLLFFASVTAHELAHSLVSQSLGTPVRDITLFIFGGAAHISEEPRRARDELVMAIAGPITSLSLGAAFGLLWLVSSVAMGPLHALAGWLAWINVALGVFNLLPGFPLDGGRVLRAVVWGLTGNLRGATLTAAGSGRVIAFGLILLGAWRILDGDWSSGLWIAFIGWFLDNAAAQSAQRLALEDALVGRTVRDVLARDYPTVFAHLTLDVFMEQVAIPSGRRSIPVVDHGRFEGLISIDRVYAVPRERWPTTRVSDVQLPRDAVLVVAPHDDLMAAFTLMVDNDVNQLPVLEGDGFVGMVAREHVLAALRPAEVDHQEKVAHA